MNGLGEGKNERTSGITKNDIFVFGEEVAASFVLVTLINCIAREIS